MRSLEWLFVIALVLYSASIWAERIVGKLRAWMIVAFGIGLAADTVGTVVLCAPAALSWKWSFHTTTGLASLAIMAVHFLWALLATRGGRAAALFHRWSVAAWLLWLSSFLSGAFIR